MEHIERYDIPEEALEKLRDPDIIRRQISEGRTFQEVLGYTQDKMENFYVTAYNLFQKQEYEKAADAFIFLTTLNPYVHNYWLGLGMSEQLNESYHSGLLAYAMAILTDMQNPLPHYHSAKCYLGINEKENAIAALETALELAGESVSHIDLLDNIKRTLHRLNG
jgi:type III secretion system low calcium response chaperone LcrH/SycD